MDSKPNRRAVLGTTAGAALSGALAAPATAAASATTHGRATVDSPDGQLRVPLPFLGPGRYDAEMYCDGDSTDWHDNPLPIDVRTETVEASTVLTLRLVGGGGTAVRFRPALS